MKSLYGYITESHGIVDGENSWRELAKHLVDVLDGHTEDQFVFDREDYTLSPWINKITIIRQEQWPGTVAAFDDDASGITNGLADITIEVGSKYSAGVIEHELQHAFDYWIAVTRRGMKNEMTDKYCVGVGYESEEINPYPIYNNVEQVNCDHIFNLFKQCSYFFEQTEVNAYAREFDLFLSNVLKDKDITFEDMFEKHINESGIGPVVWILLMYSLLENMDRFIEDDDHVDWAYVVRGLHDYWSRHYIGRNIKGKDPKDTVRKTAQYVIDHPIRKCLEKFRKVLEHHVMETGHKVTNLPKWFYK